MNKFSYQSSFCSRFTAECVEHQLLAKVTQKVLLDKCRYSIFLSFALVLSFGDAKVFHCFGLFLFGTLLEKSGLFGLAAEVFLWKLAGHFGELG